MTSKNPNKIIITGGTGYIGSHMVLALIDQGYEPVIMDNLSNSAIQVLSAIERITGKSPEFMEVDLCDLPQSKSAFLKHQDATAIVHFAALKAVGESIEKPLPYYKNNILSLVNCLELSKLINVDQMVFSSSATVYGTPKELPIKEDALLQQPTSPYGNTKKIAEEILQDFSIAHPEFKTTILRYFNPVGCHSSGLIGENPKDVHNNLMPFITQTAIGKREKLHIFGSDYDTPDGTAIRDYIHVEDLTHAHLLALNKARNEHFKGVAIYNVGIGQGVSVKEMVAAFEHFNNIKLPVVMAPRRSGDIAVLYADTTKAQQELGFQPKKTLKDMVTSAYNFEFINKK